MADKVLLLDKSVDRYISLAERCIDEEDFSGALGFLLSAERATARYDVLLKIADVYADMGLYDLSNKYLFRYIHCAPSDKVSIAYEELAINYFYTDNLWASGYYFHKKISVDGYVSKEGLDQEIIDFFSGEEFKRTAYRVAYPYDRADYSVEIKNGKRLISLGGFKDAVKTLSKIHKSRRDEEISGDLAIALFMDEDFEGAEKVCRESISAHGENVTAYCNLSTVYDMKEDYQKSQYYYEKALSLRKGEAGEAYKIATCAIEREDHVTAEECLKTILDERPYESVMRFFYGIAKLNLGKYDQAENELKTAYRLDPCDVITAHYLDIAKALKNGEINGDKFLPLKYVKELPKGETAKRTTKISAVLKTPSKFTALLKNKANRDLFVWGMLYGSDAVMRSSVLILSSMAGRAFKKTVEPLLLDPNVREELKRLLVYLLIMKGESGKIGIVAGCYYCSFAPKKAKIFKQSGGDLYLSAYALCMSKLVFFEMEDFNNVESSAVRIFKALGGVVGEGDTNNEELAALILLNSKYKQFSRVEDVKKLFEVDDYKINELIKVLNEKEKEK